MTTNSSVTPAQFETSSRKLEQFLFLHDIRYVSLRKDDDGMTVWGYNPTPETMHIVNEYRDILARRKLEKGDVLRCAN